MDQSQKDFVQISNHIIQILDDLSCVLEKISTHGAATKEDLNDVLHRTRRVEAAVAAVLDEQKESAP